MFFMVKSSWLRNPATSQNPQEKDARYVKSRRTSFTLKQVQYSTTFAESQEN